MKTEELIQLIGCCSSEILPVLVGHNFKPTDQLCELGANSVDRAEIIVLLMESKPASGKNCAFSHTRKYLGES